MSSRFGSGPIEFDDIELTDAPPATTPRRDLPVADLDAQIFGPRPEHASVQVVPPPIVFDPPPGHDAPPARGTDAWPAPVGVAPAVPVESAAPCESTAPVVPVESAAPCESTAPVAPVESAAPVESTAPVAPVESTAPVESAAPVEGHKDKKARKDKKASKDKKARKRAAAAAAAATGAAGVVVLSTDAPAADLAVSLAPDRASFVEQPVLPSFPPPTASPVVDLEPELELPPWLAPTGSPSSSDAWVQLALADGDGDGDEPPGAVTGREDRRRPAGAIVLAACGVALGLGTTLFLLRDDGGSGETKRVQVESARDTVVTTIPTVGSTTGTPPQTTTTEEPEPETTAPQTATTARRGTAAAVVPPAPSPDPDPDPGSPPTNPPPTQPPPTTTTTTEPPTTTTTTEPPPTTTAEPPPP